jgi:hypothetical protein
VPRAAVVIDDDVTVEVVELGFLAAKVVLRHAGSASGFDELR